MRRAQQRVTAGRPYADSMSDVIAHLGAHPRPRHAAEPRSSAAPDQARRIVLVTADRGPGGPCNTNVIRRATRFMLDEQR